MKVNINNTKKYETVKLSVNKIVWIIFNMLKTVRGRFVLRLVTSSNFNMFNIIAFIKLLFTDMPTLTLTSHTMTQSDSEVQLGLMLYQ